MRNHTKKVEEQKTNGAPPIAGAAPTVAGRAPVPSVDVELRLTPRDLWFVALAMRQTPWGGGEARVMVLRDIHASLNLGKINTGVPPNTLPLTPVECVSLPRAHVEQIIRVLCGEGDRAFPGDAGPMLSDVVVKLRASVVKAVSDAQRRAQV